MPREDSERVRGALQAATSGLVERSVLAELIALAAIAGEHVLVIGPPGTAKSSAVRQVARALGGSYFEYLLGRFTEPSEIFGPVDLRRLREGVVETETSGMLPEAEFAFLDEVFRGSTAILNTLLGILNERVFRRGHTNIDVPLRLCVGASNELPEDPSLAAFADRFLVHCFVEPVEDPLLERLLAAGWRGAATAESVAEIEALDRLAQRCGTVKMELVRPHLAAVIRTLRQHGIRLSDRRVVQAQKLVAAAAILAGRDTASSADLWPMIYAIPAHEAQLEAREYLHDILAAADNPVLPAAAEDASLGANARARRLVTATDEALAATPADRTGDEWIHWRARLEGIAREIDAGFAKETMPPELEDARARVTGALTADEEPGNAKVTA